jgi:hypothetical protein
MRDITALGEPIGGRGSQDKQIKETLDLYRAIFKGGLWEKRQRTNAG